MVDVYSLSQAASWRLQQEYQEYVFGSLGYDSVQGADGLCEAIQQNYTVFVVTNVTHVQYWGCLGAF